MSLVANRATQPVSPNRADLNQKSAPIIDVHVLTVKNVKGVKETVRVGWIARDTRGVVAVEDVISAVRGLSHEEAARFSRNTKMIGREASRSGSSA